MFFCSFLFFSFLNDGVSFSITSAFLSHNKLRMIERREGGRSAQGNALSAYVSKLDITALLSQLCNI